MSLIQVREKLKILDRALGEMQKTLLVAGDELVKADSLIGAILGEGMEPQRKKKRDGDGREEQPSQSDFTEEGLVPNGPTRSRRGRPRKKVEETIEVEGIA